MAPWHWQQQLPVRSLLMTRTKTASREEGGTRRVKAARRWMRHPLRFQMHKCLSQMPLLWKFRMNPASPAEGGARKAKRARQRRMRPLGQ